MSTARRWVRRFKDGEMGQTGLKTKHYFFKDGFQKLAQGWLNFIEVSGDFVEK